jgi:PAS domain-containing protein
MRVWTVGAQGATVLIKSSLQLREALRDARNSTVVLQARGWRAMLAQDVDFYRIFRINPTVMVLLSADLVVIDANDEALRVVGRALEEVVGRHVFEVLPKMRDAAGDPEWTALEAAMSSGHCECCQLKRQDIEDPAHPGVFEERYWSSMVVPIHGPDGQVEVLEFSAREMTPIIEQYRRLQGQQA